MGDLKRDKFGKFLSSIPKIKKSKRSDFFKWFNEGKKLVMADPPQLAQAGLRNDHKNYEIEDMLDIGAEIELKNDTGRSESWKVGRRVVELEVLAKGMYCCSCKCPLHLTNTVGERLYGLGGILMIECELCQTVTDVHLGKRGPSGSYDINTKASMGMIHAGMGPTHLQNFLAECNLPSIAEKTLRKKEKELSEQIKTVALQSCNLAQREEKSLSTNGNVESSFDGGWQKRGSGWNYNSNTGHATFIGKETGKVLLYDVRSRTCKTCEYYQTKETVPEHVCTINWHGSSKSMEADMAVSMAHTLKDNGCEINVIHADNDASTSARLEVEFENIKKRDDQNHTKKGISLCLHDISKSHKELQKDETKQYLLRCFMYAITSADNEEEIRIGLQRIVPHVFGSHQHCEEAEWCNYHDDPENFVYKSLPNGKPLKSDSLKVELNTLVDKLIRRDSSLINLGSTQSNESFNQLVSVKAPKSRHYGGSCSLQNRVSVAVLQKNDGYGYLSKVNEAANLSPGEFTMAVASVRDKKMEKRKAKKKTKEYKIDRIRKKRNKNKKERKHLVREGKTYESQMELNAHEDPEQSTEIPLPLTIDGTETKVFFDLETTGLGRKSDIIQISAKANEKFFNRYVIPNVEIDIEASRVTGITYSHATHKMYVHGEIVEPVSLHKALIDFIYFLKEHNQPILFGHNICNFDIPILVNKLKEWNLFTTLCQTVKGFIDTMKVAKKYISKNEVRDYKQQTLVQQFVGDSYLAHNAIEDVDTLKRLHDIKFAQLVKSVDLFSIFYHQCMDSYTDLLQKKIVSRPVCIQLAKGGLSFKHLKLASERDANGIKYVLQDYKIPAKSLKAIHKYFQREE